LIATLTVIMLSFAARASLADRANGGARGGLRRDRRNRCGATLAPERKILHEFHQLCCEERGAFALKQGHVEQKQTDDQAAEKDGGSVGHDLGAETAPSSLSWNGKSRGT
jgi:hypothetical protein